jgi:hypothetical protein
MLLSDGDQTIILKSEKEVQTSVTNLQNLGKKFNMK